MARTLPLALLLVLAGCFTIDGTLEENGSGTLVLDYIPEGNATIESETAQEIA